jgi:hypothetical protein
MDWVLGILNAYRVNATYNYAADHAEIVLFTGAILFLLMKKNFGGALTLGLGGALCYANYYMFSHQLYFTLPPEYSIGFAAVSSFLLVLVVYKLMHPA